MEIPVAATMTLNLLTIAESMILMSLKPPSNVAAVEEEALVTLGPKIGETSLRKKK